MTQTVEFMCHGVGTMAKGFRSDTKEFCCTKGNYPYPIIQEEFKTLKSN